jgi:hypothetical protein
MNLGTEDFTGDAADDRKYGFKLPDDCTDEDSCVWICNKMVKADGISDDAIDSE